MTGKNLEEFSLAHSRAIACPTVKNLLLASRAALQVTDNCNDVQSAWTWYAAATDLASTGGIKFQSVNSRFPPTWFARRQIDEALKRLPSKDPKSDRHELYSSLSQALITWEQTGTTKDALLAARAALYVAESTTTSWMAWSWAEIADDLASYARIELDSLGFAVCPDVVGGISDVKKALANLPQEGTE